MSRHWHLRSLVFFVAVSVIGARAWAEETTRSKQATILARVLSYELSLEERAGDRVGVAIIYKVGDAESESSAGNWQRAFDELSSVRIKDKTFFATRVPSNPERLEKAVDQEGVDVLLVVDGLAADVKWIAQFARARHVLTAGSTPSYVEGELTLCVAEENDRTRIFVNLNNAGREGIRFSSSLLKLAILVR